MRDTSKIHVLKSGMIVDKMIISILVICVIILILYLAFSSKADPMDGATTVAPTIYTTTRRKKYFVEYD